MYRITIDVHADKLEYVKGFLIDEGFDYKTQAIPKKAEVEFMQLTKENISEVYNWAKKASDQVVERYSLTIYIDKLLVTVGDTIILMNNRLYI